MQRIDQIVPEDRRSGCDRRDFPRDGEGRRASDRERQRKVDCPFCTHYDSIVVDGWHTEGVGYIRRRECQNPMCRAYFRTVETPQMDAPLSLPPA
jgi:hypothetical protein